MNVLLAAFISFVIILFFGLRWMNNLTIVKHSIPFKNIFEMEALSKLFKVLTPFQLDIPFRSFYLKSFKVPIMRSASLSLFELLIDLFISSIFVLVIGQAIPLGFPKWLLVIPLFLFVLLLFFSKYFVKPFMVFKGKYIQKIAKLLSEIPETIHLFAKLKLRVIVALILSALIFILRASVVYAVALALSIQIDFYLILLTVCVSAIIVFFSRIPGAVSIPATGGLMLHSTIGAELGVILFGIEQIIGYTVIFLVGGFASLEQFSRIKQFLSKKKS